VTQNAYCSECGTRVELTEAGACSNGHPRSSLRDVQDGPLFSSASHPVSAPRPISAPRPSAPVSGPKPAAPAPNLKPADDLAAKTMGRLIVIVPIGLVVAFALWSSYAASVGFGMSKGKAWLAAFGDLLVTAAIVAFFVWRRREKMKR
jgi:hypothetical protein